MGRGRSNRTKKRSDRKMVAVEKGVLTMFEVLRKLRPGKTNGQLVRESLLMMTKVLLVCRCGGEVSAVDEKGEVVFRITGAQEGELEKLIEKLKEIEGDESWWGGVVRV